jgi:hypothetical protein
MGFSAWNPDPSATNSFAYFNAVNYLLTQSVPTSINVVLEYNGTLNFTSHQGVGIRWDQNFRTFNYDKIYCEYSIDNGVTWLAAGGGEMYPSLGSNYYAPIFKYINLSNQVGNQSSVKIRFRWESLYTGSNPNGAGAGYGWMIDNVLVLGLGNNDLSVEKVFPRFYGIGYYSLIPDRQRMKISSVKSIVMNNGNIAQTNIHSNLDIRVKGSSVSDFTATNTIPYSTLYIGSRDTMATDTFSYVPPTGANIYSIQNTATQMQTDLHPLDNSDTITFGITDTIFARDRNYNGKFGPTMVANTNDGDFSTVGYYISKPDTVHSISVFIASGSKLGGKIAGVISYWESGNTLTDQIYTNDYTITSSDINKWVTISFKPAFDGFSELLEGNKIYYAGIKYYWKTIAPTTTGIYIGTDPDVPLITSDWVDGVNYFVKSGGIIYGHLTEMPKIRLNVSDPHSQASAHLLAQDKNIPVVYPNPSTGIVSIINAKGAKISIYDMIGTCVYQWENITGKIDLSGLKQGSYLLKFNEGNNVSTKKLTIIR